MAKEIAQVPLRRHGVAHLETYDVTADELEQIEREAGNVGLDFQVSLFCLTEATAFLTALLTMSTTSDRVYNMFVTFVVVGVMGGVIYGIRWVRAKKSFAGMLQKIRDRPIGPVGSDDKETTAAQLAELPSGEPPSGEGT